jgi:hypothetical protein
VDYFSDVLTQQLYQQNVFQATQGRQSIEGNLTGTFGMVTTTASYQRHEIVRGTDASSVYGNAPRFSGSVAPRMLFGLPLYGSLNTEYAVVKNQERAAGLVTSDRTLNRWDVAPSLRLPLSSLTYLSVNTSAAYRTTYYSRSLDPRGNLTPVALLRQFLSVRSEFIGPVVTKIWDTPSSGRTERMKHVVEPAFAVDYTTEIANQARVPRTNDQSDTVVGGTSRARLGSSSPSACSRRTTPMRRPACSTRPTPTYPATARRRSRRSRSPPGCRRHRSPTPTFEWSTTSTAMDCR